LILGGVEYASKLGFSPHRIDEAETCDFSRGRKLRLCCCFF
jgi:hypothetical protein